MAGGACGRRPGVRGGPFSPPMSRGVAAAGARSPSSSRGSPCAAPRKQASAYEFFRG